MNVFRQYGMIVLFLITNALYASLGFHFTMVVCGTISLIGLLRVNAIHQAGGRVPFISIAMYWYALLIVPVFQYAMITESVIILGSYLASLALIAGIASGLKDTFNEWKEETFLRLVAVSEFIKRTHSRPYSRPTETLRGDTDIATVSDTQRWIDGLHDAGIDATTLHEMLWGVHDYATVNSWFNGSTFGMPEPVVCIISDLHRYFCDLEEFDIDAGLLEVASEHAVDRRAQQVFEEAHTELIGENEVSADYTVEGASESR